MRARILLITPLILGAPSMAIAESHGGAHKVGFSYHIMHDYDDDGFAKVDGADAPRKTFTTNANAYVDLSGSMGDSSYQLYMNTLGGNLDSAVEVAMAKTMICKGMTVGVGRDYANQGGYDNALFDGQTIMPSMYTTTYTPLPLSSNILQLESDFGAGGTVTLQVLDDVTVTDANGDGIADAGSKGQFNEAPQSQPTFALEWIGNFGMVSPMIQYFAYDQGHSMYASLGLGVMVSGANIHFDYITDSRAVKVGGKDEKNAITNLVLDVDYNAGMVTPFLKYANHSTKQAVTDVKGNQSIADTSDNFTQILVGTTVNMYDHMQPYLAVKMSSADVLKDTTKPTGSTDSKSAQSIILGIRGAF